MKSHSLSERRFWMGLRNPGLGALRVGLAVGLLVFVPKLWGETTRTQTISLQKGWNAVFLQVSPTNPEPAGVFAGTPITLAATYFAVEKPVQFIQDPARIGWNKEGWGVWYSPSRPDSFLSSLYAIHGERAYLIFSQQDYSWRVTGTVGLAPVRWKAASFNLTGFCLDDLSPPTFDQFFSSSAAHRPYRIYRLAGGQWTLVSDAVGTRMRSGEAYWIYCAGASDYQGPLRATLVAGQGIDFDQVADSWIKLANQSSNPLDVQVETISTDGGLPLAYTIRGITQGMMNWFSIPLPAVYQVPTLEAGESTSFWLKLRRDQMVARSQSTLLKLTTDNGVQLWVPVTGSRNDLISNSSSTSQP